MGKVLTKSYKRWEPGTVLTSDQDEFAKAVISAPRDRTSGLLRYSTVYVNAERMAQLEREGYFS